MNDTQVAPDKTASGGQTQRRLAIAALALRRTCRHFPPWVLAMLTAYFAYRLLVEPGWFSWSCTAVAATGFLLNLVVIVANGGQMPAAIDPADLEENDLYKPINEQTRLLVLTDRIDVGPWLISAGDVLLFSALIVSVAGRLFDLV